MCDKTCCCQQHRNGGVQPAECSHEQIRACHGEDAGHPCVMSSDEEDDE